MLSRYAASAAAPYPWDFIHLDLDGWFFIVWHLLGWEYWVERRRLCSRVNVTRQPVQKVVSKKRKKKIEKKTNNSRFRVEWPEGATQILVNMMEKQVSHASFFSCN